MDKFIEEGICPICADKGKLILRNIILREGMIGKTSRDKGDVLRGIRKVYDLMRQGRVRINKGNCPNLINEMQNYRFKEGTENPIDEFNHLLDPLRYIIFAQEGYKVKGVKTIYVPRKPFERIDI